LGHKASQRLLAPPFTGAEKDESKGRLGGKLGIVRADAGIGRRSQNKSSELLMRKSPNREGRVNRIKKETRTEKKARSLRSF